MLFAFLTTVLWSTSAVAARRLVDLLGTTLANLARLVLATVLLAAWAFTFGGGTDGRGVWWFVLSGVVGFGFGDVALYFALARLGARLMLLLTQCLAAPIAAIVEWLWLGTRLTPTQIALGAGVIAGVALALVPKDNAHIPAKRLFSGIGYGVLAAAGQGLGAVLSRKAFEVSTAGGLTVDGGTAAFQRIIGGLCVGLVAWWFLRQPSDPSAPTGLGSALRHRKFLLVLFTTALGGPVIGVACYQWALATTPSGLVLPIVALSPIVILPFSYWLEHDRPKMRSLAGGALAVACAIALARAGS